MTIEMTRAERDVLVHLLDEAIRDMGPEIRRTMTSTYKDDLKERKRVMRNLHERLLADTAAESPQRPTLV